MTSFWRNLQNRLGKTKEERAQTFQNLAIMALLIGNGLQAYYIWTLKDPSTFVRGQIAYFRDGRNCFAVIKTEDGQSSASIDCSRMPVP